MADSSKSYTDVHDIDELIDDPNTNNGDPETPESIDDEETEVGSNEVDDKRKELIDENPS